MAIPQTKLRHIGPEFIVSDRACENCGYSLHGLRTDGVCPECGHSIGRRVRGPRYNQQLVNAPLPWLDVLATGATLMFLSAMGVIVLAITLTVVRKPAVLVILGLVSLGWFGGVWICTRPRPPLDGSTYDTRREWRGLRVASRLTQACWPAACTAAIGALAAFNTGASPFVVYACTTAAAAFVLCAVGGLAPMSALLAHLADWAEDSGLAQGFRGCAWFVCFCPTVIGLVILNGFTGVLGTLGGALLMTIIMGVFYIPPFFFLWCLFRFQRTASWAVWNHVAAEAKLDRFRARAAANARMPRPDPDRPPPRRG